MQDGCFHPNAKCFLAPTVRHSVPQGTFLPSKLTPDLVLLVHVLNHASWENMGHFFYSLSHGLTCFYFNGTIWRLFRHSRVHALTK